MPRLLFALLLATPAAAGDWPGWRGPAGDGSATDPAVPVRWTATENVAWAVPVPGVGHSSPVVSHGAVYLTAAVGPDRLLLAYDARTGAEKWRATVVAAPPERTHRNSSPANATPVTDGSRVWTAFVADGAVVATCHSAAGDRVWQRAFPGFASPHGFCGSPVLAGGLLVVNGDSDGDAFLAGLDRLTGAVGWKVPRPHRTRSFSVPVLLDVAGGRQLVLAGSKGVTAFDPATGGRLWWADSPTDKFVATVAYAGGVVAATGTSPAPTFVGIRPDGRGDVTRSHVLWSNPKAACYVPSPLAVGDRFFAVTDAGVATLLDAKTGTTAWSERLGRHHDASPLLVNGLVYALADDGTTFVVKPGPEFELVAKNPLGEACHATPAVADGALFVRTASRLVRVGGPAGR